ncbi:hypothetical protein BSAF29S_06612 [Bacillus safensis subsp. safensis]
MFAYCMKRAGMLIPVLIGMTLVVFSIIRFIPGNPAQVILGQRATKEAVEQLTIQLGLISHGTFNTVIICLAF